MENTGLFFFSYILKTELKKNLTKKIEIIIRIVMGLNAFS